MSGRSRPPARLEPRPVLPIAPSASAGRGAAWAVALVAAACVLISVTFVVDDPDVWQHLAVGRAIWREGRIPMTHQWTWPSYGTPEVLPSWGFRALLWPFWSVGGLWGLYAWRWLTTLGAFALLGGAARRLGARGLSTFVVIVLAGLTWRLRSQARPETLVAILLALEILVLESYRRDARPRRLWLLIPIAIAWANVHLSYYLGLALIAIHALDAAWSGRSSKGTAKRPRRASAEGDTAAASPRSPGALAAFGLACAAASFLNPFGLRALTQPFEYFFVWRHEPIYQTIVEIHPLMWSAHWKSGLPLLMLAWPTLALVRARRRGLDGAEWLTLVLFTGLALSTQRFAGLYALAVVPYLARDLDEWNQGRAWPRWTARDPARAATVAALCVGACVLEWTRPEMPLGVGVDWTQVPVGACDFMSRAGVRGRGFDPYYFGGYQLWRFWPDRERLPFMDIHQSGTVEDRRLYAYAFAESSAWRALDRERHFDYALLDGRPVPGDHLVDRLDADSTWALAFRDDAAALFVRRGGSLDSLARHAAFRFVPAGDAGMARLVALDRTNPAARPAIRAELERMIAGSPWHSRAVSQLATLEWIEGDLDRARGHLLEARRIDPRAPETHRRLAMLALAQGQAREAIAELEAERRLGAGIPGLDFLFGQAYTQAGDRDRARAAYRRELAKNPGNAAARDSLAAIER